MVLALLGKPSEDYALRLLATCGGQRTIKALEPLLDGEDVPRAVYAAWTLAQLPDKTASDMGRRRFAIYAMFHDQIYQSGSGIDFKVAPDLSFHQSTSHLNPKTYEPPVTPVVIPDELRRPFPLGNDEARFAVRAYRYTTVPGSSNPTRAPFPSSAYRSQADPLMDASWLPLLQVIATEDPRIKAMEVEGKKVPHFLTRQVAAKTIARITGQEASYIGLTGEAIDSAMTPRTPYANQIQLLLNFYREQVQRSNLRAGPETDVAWKARDELQSLRLLLRDSFGVDVEKE